MRWLLCLLIVSLALPTSIAGIDDPEGTAMELVENYEESTLKPALAGDALCMGYDRSDLPDSVRVGFDECGAQSEKYILIERTPTGYDITICGVFPSGCVTRSAGELPALPDPPVGDILPADGEILHEW